ncbi:hypothetical protein [Nostocoides sp. HKS02]|uniref:hypothetical protein n=1 Tax=Nostocoides sp. HKS02 TaxID=1813880 RepID=UPI0012B4A157|nr:hypothetical protein [Tetrasphaera sp. HKS02]QGN58095.1 hypothetical protein GKE56_09550 [Tetrasphaera sp. HKS02]
MSPQLPAGQDWVLRADMAALIRKSEDTVRRLVTKHELATRTDDKGRVLVRVDDFVTLGHLRHEDLTAGLTPAESAQVLRARESVTALRVQIAELTGRLAAAEGLSDTLREQLAQKDRQIAKQGDLLSRLIGQIAGAA